MTAPSSFKFSLQAGAGGTWVEVTSDVLFEEGPILYTDARTSQFDGFSPGTFPLTLNNSTGKYTPNNPNTSLAVPLSEGMGVCMELAGALFSGTIRSAVLVFPPLESASKARVRITTDDMLGNAARHAIGDLYTATVDAGGPYLSWPLSEPAGSAAGAEVIAGSSPLAGALDYAFGATSHIPVPGTYVRLAAAGSGELYMPNPVAPPLVYDQANVGAWGFWVERTTDTAEFALAIFYGGMADTLVSPAINTFNIRSFSGDLTMRPGFGTRIIGPTFTPGVAFYCAVEVATVFAAGEWTLTYTFYVDGVSYGSSDYVQNSLAPVTSLTNADRQPVRVVLQTSVGPGDVFVSRISHTSSLVNEYAVRPATAEVRLQGIAGAVPEVTLDTIPTMSDAILGAQDGGSALDMLNAVIKAEQGYMWSETTGTLLAPVQKIEVAARNRERPVDYTFDVSEILDPIPFLHSLTNTVSEATADGPETSATYQDPTLVPLVGSANTSDQVPLRDFTNLYGYASDRVVRGINTGVAITAVTIDATSPLINRWTDLTAIRQGFVLAITGLPSSQLNYDTWHGYVVGREINNTQDSQTDEPKTFFTFYLAPRVPVALYDDATTARFAAGGTLSLTSNITDSATSISVTSTGVLFTTTGGHFPQDIRIGDEVITISGVSGGSSPQTFTASVRGAVDPLTGLATTAVAHTAGDNVELAQPALYAY